MYITDIYSDCVDFCPGDDDVYNIDNLSDAYMDMQICRLLSNEDFVLHNDNNKRIKVPTVISFKINFIYDMMLKIKPHIELQEINNLFYHLEARLHDFEESSSVMILKIKLNWMNYCIDFEINEFNHIFSETINYELGNNNFFEYDGETRVGIIPFNVNEQFHSIMKLYSDSNDQLIIAGFHLTIIEI